VPTRTIVQDLCDVCYAEASGLESEASDRLRFGFLGRDYVLLACEKHADPIRNELQRLSELGTPDGGRRRVVGAQRASRMTSSVDSGGKTLFSQLDDDEKLRFRFWAELPHARRIADARVQAWIDAGRP